MEGHHKEEHTHGGVIPCTSCVDVLNHLRDGTRSVCSTKNRAYWPGPPDSQENLVNENGATCLIKYKDFGRGCLIDHLCVVKTPFPPMAPPPELKLAQSSIAIVLFQLLLDTQHVAVILNNHSLKPLTLRFYLILNSRLY